MNSYGQWAKTEQISPYPLDIVIGKDGKVSFITHEFEVTSLTAAIEKALL